MGTRCLTRVYDESDQLLLFLYRQMDGSPSGHGVELKEAVGNVQLVNGLGDNVKNVANGMGCFAAQLVTRLKDAPGGFYIQAPSDEFSWASYIYDFRPNLPGHPGWSNGKKDQRHLMLKVTCNFGDNPVIFDGMLADFDPAKATDFANKHFASKD